MTDFFSFVPQPNGPYTFTPTMDNASYSAVVTWNVVGKRYYVSLYAADGTRVFTLPVIGSPIGFDIQSLAWLNGVVTVRTVQAHGLPFGTVVDFTISGCTPTAYNQTDGIFIVTGPFSLTYALAVDPGMATVLGKISHDVDIAGGYFNTSTLVFREANQQFEVNP